MRGYSGSGKSTKARQIAQDTGAVVVCRDNLRKMLLGEYWTGRREDEDRVSIAEEAQVLALLGAGVPVVVDATHLVPQFLRRWARIATRHGVDFEVVDVHCDPADCKRNDHGRMLAGGRYVGDRVIDEQVRKHPVEKWPVITATPFTVDPYRPPMIKGSKPPAILVDIDGTLAHMQGRSPYDYDKVGTDAIDPVIRDLVNEWKYKDPRNRNVIVLSGRDGKCFYDTRRWLWRFGVDYDALIMRERDDNRPDYLVKYELFNKYIRDNYDVKFVLDDRQQVVDMWRKLGLKCLQVAEGNF
ncbi:polynucleotide kinase [Mycobacterium colombiense]|uniref:Polynucleotide kinase n=1 Tax=Mycobacterium colombiense TaxID=339268 RepID=A0A329MCP2_9MYCO|nr:AAA family ATPase [Mycobacterium colombiense]RAV17630.1 polynucleotide kinase [Mycobacterium colombiense]